MSGFLADAHALASLLIWTSVAFATTTLVAVVVERAAFLLGQVRQQSIERRYAPLVQAALAGDARALDALVRSPSRHRFAVAVLLVAPLIDHRDADRIERTRAIVQAMPVMPLVDRYLRSWWWWRRAIALRALGLIQAFDRTAAIVGALDDSHPDVRAAALDALTDLRDPASLQAIVVRFHDATLHRGRRAAALTAFGTACEPFLLELAQVDPTHRVNYARALTMCGTARSRAVLCGWTQDSRAEVRAAAFEALAHVGLDDEAARLAIAALAHPDVAVRTMAAYALHGWRGHGGGAARLVPLLDDVWPVAVRAARSLQSMGPAARPALQARASRADLGGLLARQMLWQEKA